MSGHDEDHAYARVSEKLAGTPFATIRYLEETGSTNADAAALLGDAACAGLTLVAEHQSRGSGRKGRAWIARPGTALLFTTILPVELDANSLWLVPYWAAIAIRDALAHNGVTAQLHWPNDLLVRERKLAGILCASRVIGDRARVACGVGINVRRYPEAAAEIEPAPAFCDDETNTIERAELLRSILQAFAATLPLLDDAAEVVRSWESAAGVPGARYRIAKDADPTAFEATALKLLDGGALLVRHGDGTQEAIALADARALRG